VVISFIVTHGGVLCFFLSLDDGLSLVTRVILCLSSPGGLGSGG
jgi:hypothetical protein